MNTKHIAKLALAAGALLIATSALAQQSAPANKPVAAPRGPAQAAGPDTVFAAWDKNKDGVLSKEEFTNGWNGTRDAMATQRLHMEFARRDTNKSNKLEPNEYATLAIVQRAGKNAAAFAVFDTNKDGGLDFAEYIEFVRISMKNMPPATATPAPAAKK